MLTTRAHQNTNPNETGMNFSVELSDELRAAFGAAGVDTDSIRIESDGTIYVDRAEGHIAIGEDGDWVTATAYDADDDHVTIYEGESVPDMAAAVAHAMR